MEKVRGFNKLSLGQQELLKQINKQHKANVGNDYKNGWTPIAVKPQGRNLQVTFKNGEWLYYTPEGTWF